MDVDQYTEFCTILCAYAESDFVYNARSKKPTSSGYYSEGLFQQTYPWWKNDHYDINAATQAFLEHFNRVTSDPVKDCWFVQHWDAPDPRVDPVGFSFAVETVNYSNRVNTVGDIIKNRQLPS